MEKSGHKRTSVHHEDAANVKAILLDLEGTLIPTGFVKDRLFGYVKDNSASFLLSNFDDPAIQEIIAAFRSQAAADVKNKVEGSAAIPDSSSVKADIIAAVVENIGWHLGKGSITEGVEMITVQILEEAYEKEDDIFTEIFDDVVPALKQWSNKGIKSYVLSSRSDEFQKLLFANTKDGDLTENISKFVGLGNRPKSVKETYVTIAEDLELTPGDIYFVTSSANETTAASAAGLQSFLVIRDGSTKLDEKISCPIVHLLTEVLDGAKAEGSPQKKKACHADLTSGDAEVHN